MRTRKVHEGFLCKHIAFKVHAPHIVLDKRPRFILTQVKTFDAGKCAPSLALFPHSSQPGKGPTTLGESACKQTLCRRENARSLLLPTSSPSFVSGGAINKLASNAREKKKGGHTCRAAFQSLSKVFSA
ncbi:unnamed protein product [Ixodes pacificus]